MRKPLFSVLGTAQRVEGKIRFVPKSLDYLNHKLSKLPMGKELELSISAVNVQRSNAQLNYHWVIVGLIAEHTGHTEPEIHDAVLRAKFGEKKIKLGPLDVAVRRSVSDLAKMSKDDMSSLIEFDERLAAELEVRIPTARELGYLTDEKGRMIK